MHALMKVILRLQIATVEAPAYFDREQDSSSIALLERNK
jgi:hypothetical protein